MAMTNEPAATAHETPRVPSTESAQVPALRGAGPRPVRSRAYVLAYLAVAVPICFLLLGRTDLVSMEGIIALGGRHAHRRERQGDARRSQARRAAVRLTPSVMCPSGLSVGFVHWQTIRREISWSTCSVVLPGSS